MSLGKVQKLTAAEFSGCGNVLSGLKPGMIGWCWGVREGEEAGIAADGMFKLLMIFANLLLVCKYRSKTQGN